MRWRAIAASTSFSGACRAADALPFRRIGLEIGGRAWRRVPAHMLQPRLVGFLRAGSARAAMAAPSSAPVPRSAARQNTQLPSLKRSTRPASPNSLEMAGNPGLGLAHNLDQLADRRARPARSSSSRRNRVGSPAATQHGNQPVQVALPTYKHIFICSAQLRLQGVWISARKTGKTPRNTGLPRAWSTVDAGAGGLFWDCAPRRWPPARLPLAYA